MTPSPLIPDPDLFHQLHHSSSVLTLAVSDEYIFAGTQDGEITVWSLATLELVQKIQAHKRSVLSLHLTPDHSLLFSSAGDAVVSAWCPKNLTRLYEIYSTYDVGDIFCVAYSKQYETVYIGAQNASIQWVCLTDPANRSSQESAKHPDLRNHRFFDSKAVGGGAATPRRTDEKWTLIPKPQTILEIPQGSITQYAHYGYVYCMLVAKGSTVLVDAEEEILISGGGDGTIKMWKLGGDRQEEDNPEDGIREIATLGLDDAESVLSLAIDGSFLYSGKLDGFIELWDLDTKQKLRVIKAHTSDVMTLQMSRGYLWSSSAVGTASKHSTVHYGEYKNTTETVSQKYQCLARWKAHDGKILASATSSQVTNQFYITGGNDNKVSLWRFDEAACATAELSKEKEDMMFTSLREFVSYKTISSRSEFSEDCRKGATFLRVLFKRLGAHVEVLSSSSSSASHHNPVVLARFSGKKEPAESRKRILFYGHYDVVVADNKRGAWTGDPFAMRGSDGYLYGRGVSDNKGPIIAALYAVTDLMASKQLDSDVIFLIEGEEESGSRGFQDIVRQHHDTIGKIDHILIANSYWLDDDTPCLTYGLRGVLHATVCIDSRNPDLHSGVDGSYLMDEPLSDLTTLLSKLKGPKNKVMIPRFYEGILPLTAEEDARFDQITTTLLQRNAGNVPAKTLKQSIMARWREPNVTIHRYKVSGPEGSLVSSHASGNVSLRLVPGQEIRDVIKMLTEFLETEFGNMGSENSITITIDNQAEPWLGDPANQIFQTLEGAVMEVWGPLFKSMAADESGKVVDTSPGEGIGAEDSAAPEKPRKPLYIREGGSIPAIRFLEKEFGAPAAHFPCGQASDAAHLANERMRVTNLLKSREIFGLVFQRL
ncbi:putative di- and tripeptidase DUG2 [Zalerion maritima]|uniref:Di- and tripeptidase DUG2 n=1 Tax=Zalerion maritima TaxID=339359 RepID=A0AAD5WXN4_9PEZI|nr:putative di- and tripeptidase DUG2 [Zalerion maritima]